MHMNINNEPINPNERTAAESTDRFEPSITNNDDDDDDNNIYYNILYLSTHTSSYNCFACVPNNVYILL